MMVRMEYEAGLASDVKLKEAGTEEKADSGVGQRGREIYHEKFTAFAQGCKNNTGF